MGLGFRVKGQVFRVASSGLRVYGLGFRVWGLGPTIFPPGHAPSLVAPPCVRVESVGFRV